MIPVFPISIRTPIININSSSSGGPEDISNSGFFSYCDTTPHSVSSQLLSCYVFSQYDSYPPACLWGIGPPPYSPVYASSSRKLSALTFEVSWSRNLCPCSNPISPSWFLHQHCTDMTINAMCNLPDTHVTRLLSVVNHGNMMTQCHSPGT